MITAFAELRFHLLAWTFLTWAFQSVVKLNVREENPGGCVPAQPKRDSGSDKLCFHASAFLCFLWGCITSKKVLITLQIEQVVAVFQGHTKSDETQGE